ncbi:DUF4190 domain-containing protein [Puerhibacterium puerhi]|uniref:DUF4190 domain-containing protein n=1 Tax=Puerhibacterium puerhi TaxID=2692623 RepID=UPI00135B4CDF|nr:DUF4190 domain-containing protein [Puerhibacterium puerhi]
MSLEPDRRPAFPPARPAYEPEPAHAGAVPARRRTEPTAVGSLLTGLLGIVVPLVGVLAIVLGGIGLDRTRRRGTQGRGMAATGITLGSIQVVVTALVVVAGVWLWSTVGDDVERGLAQVNELAQTDYSVPDLLLAPLTDGVSLGEVAEWLGTAAQVQELGGLGEQCQAGDLAACQDVVDRLPADLVPEQLRQGLPAAG